MIVVFPQNILNDPPTLFMPIAAVRDTNIVEIQNQNTFMGLIFRVGSNKKYSSAIQPTLNQLAYLDQYVLDDI